MDINYLVELSLKDTLNPDNIFQNGKPNDNAKYVPKFLKKIKDKNPINLKKIFHINSRNIRGTNISIDANKDEIEADKLLRSQGMIV